MKLELFLITVLALAGTALFFHETQTQSDDVYQMYQAWKVKYNQFTNGRDDEYRFAVFQNNYKFAQEMNANSQNTFTLGVDNQFAAMTNEEFREMMGNKVLRQNPPAQGQANTNAPAAPPTTNINWVQKGAVYAIQNQGQCGSCWAFSAVSQLEGLYQINTGKLMNFSEQQVCSCTPSPSMGCNGGYPENAFSYAAKAGLEQASYYPYVQLNNPVTAKCNYNASQATTGINTGYGNVQAQNGNALYTQLTKQPVSILVDGGSLVFQLYNGGIINSTACGTQLDHAISLVGYTTGTTPYWTVRNSWGTTWGQAGYAQIAYQDSGAGYCGILLSPSYPVKN